MPSSPGHQIKKAHHLVMGLFNFLSQRMTEPIRFFTVGSGGAPSTVMNLRCADSQLDDVITCNDLGAGTQHQQQ